MSEIPLDLFVRRVTTGMAVAAGFVLLVLTILTVVSVTGRALIWAGFGPIPGDFELVEIGTAVVVFGFFPYCHLNRGHVTVDIAVKALPTPAFNAVTLMGDLFVGLITLVVAWRLWFGFQEKIAYGESTIILGVPLWYGYGLCFVAALWGGVVAVYVLSRDLRVMTKGLRLP